MLISLKMFQFKREEESQREQEKVKEWKNAQWLSTCGIDTVFHPFAFVTPNFCFAPSVRSAQHCLTSANEFSHFNNHVLTALQPQKAGTVKASMPEFYI